MMLLDIAVDNTENYHTTTFISGKLSLQLIDWLIRRLHVSRSGHVEENDGEMFHRYGAQLFSSYLIQNFKSFKGK